MELNDKVYRKQFVEQFGSFENGGYLGMSLVFGRLVRMTHLEKEQIAKIVGYDYLNYIHFPVDNYSDLYVDGHTVTDMFPVPYALWIAMAVRWDSGKITTMDELSSYTGNYEVDMAEYNEGDEEPDYGDKRLNYAKQAVYQYFKGSPRFCKPSTARTVLSEYMDQYKVSDDYDYFIIPTGF